MRLEKFRSQHLNNAGCPWHYYPTGTFFLPALVDHLAIPTISRYDEVSSSDTLPVLRTVLQGEANHFDT